MFQFYNLMPMLSAQKNVELPLLLTKLSAGERKKRAAIALQLVGLADRAAHKPTELSGGQQQRVSIARAIVSDPTLLVCDEPTGDLDRQSAEEVLGLLRALNRDHGKTILMVTHDPKAAEYANHTLHLDKGTLVEQGTPGRQPARGADGRPAMKYLHLVWASLFRRKTRTFLTLVSIIAAFLLFGLLDAVRDLVRPGRAERQRRAAAADRLQALVHPAAAGLARGADRARCRASSA